MAPSKHEIEKALTSRLEAWSKQYQVADNCIEIDDEDDREVIYEYDEKLVWSSVEDMLTLALPGGLEVTGWANVWMATRSDESDAYMIAKNPWTDEGECAFYYFSMECPDCQRGVKAPIQDCKSCSGLGEWNFEL